ncbi:WD repeat-containing protein 6-like isoform X1 [Argiope bruennichi]|uniref:WD repeat-containing protein 6-like isoform X1 n=1 Tax=Argiope bruennichi TaxID=94029 RepID=UPI002493F2ED|nr:WD repeat-containing protein 6-like isoform X1 [Argiope bruennichi]
MEYQLERQHLCTHITTIKTFENYLFVAESNQILLYDWKKRILLEKEVVFQSCSVHGIRIETSNKVLFFGAKSVRIYVIEVKSVKRLKSITEEFYLNDWIHDVQWLKENRKVPNSFAAISAHNCLSVWNINKTQTSIFQSTENCILYAGCIICCNSELIVVAAGTVFKEIILWSPNSISESNGRKPSIHNLTGHQGVIFSISYNKHYKLLSSTSDDRSVRLWKVHSNSALNDDTLEFWEKAAIQVSHVLFAHESRVWMSTVLDNCILSVGEDSQICFWDLNGVLLKKKKAHKGGSIWCLETAHTLSINDNDESKPMKKYIAFTGGSDGGVYMWDVENAFVSGKISQISLHSKDISSTADFPRITCLLTGKLEKHLMVTTDKGWLSLYNMELKNWEDIFYDNAFSSYCVPSVSIGSLYLALGSISGEVALLSLKDYSPGKIEIKKFTAHENKICSLHWVNEASDHLLTCSIKGHMIFWKVTYENEEFNMVCVQELFLPKCKHHWWSTAALYITSEDCIIVGDRSGSISIYSKLHTKINPKSEDNKIIPCMSHRYIHGDNGVTDIQQHKSLIYSAGRDGKVQLYVLHDNNLNLLHTIKVSHDLEWIGRMLFYDEDLLLLGFHTKNFMVWSTQLESSIMTVECGGGHRSWDFCLSEDGTATFAAIKKKDVIFCSENLQHILNKSFLKTGISGQEFCCTAYLFTKNINTLGSMSVVACGGEDNALRIIGFVTEVGKEHEVLSLCNLSGHLSSIKAISKLNLFEENAYLVVSVGGRAQMMIWRITDDISVQGQQLGSFILSGLGETVKHCKKDSKNIQFDPQTRLMDVAICRPEEQEFSSGTYIISTACSDSYFRIYTFDIYSRKLSLCFNLHHGEHCILSLSQILLTNDSNKNIFFVTGATDGYIKVFNQKLCRYKNSMQSNILPQVVMPDLRMKSHQSGINALDVKAINDTNWLIGTAGDDNALSLSIVQFERLSSEDIKCTELSRAQIKSAHASEITGLKILNRETIVTASIDQRINVWTWKLIEGDLAIDLAISKISLIPDIAHLEAWQNKITKIWTLLVCGQGIESFTFAMCDTNM